MTRTRWTVRPSQVVRLLRRVIRLLPRSRSDQRSEDAERPCPPALELPERHSFRVLGVAGFIPPCFWVLAIVCVRFLGLQKVDWGPQTTSHTHATKEKAAAGRV